MRRTYDVLMLFALSRGGLHASIFAIAMMLFVSW